MDLTTYTAISPIDGRYFNKTSSLSSYFSEFALMKYRVQVEIEYILKLSELDLKNLKRIEKKDIKKFRAIYMEFNSADFKWIKKKEQSTNHDVKAVEYFVKEKVSQIGYENILEFIHFGLTSQDINNTAIPLSLRDAVKNEYAPIFESLISKLKKKEKAYWDIPMLARTHGQPASPTRLGKEIKVFTERLSIQYEQLAQIPFCAKFGGATGNFNAHQVAFPDVDWKKAADELIESLNLQRSQTTTQIEHYDNLAALFDCLKRIVKNVSTIFID